MHGSSWIFIWVEKPLARWLFQWSDLSTRAPSRGSNSPSLMRQLTCLLLQNRKIGALLMKSQHGLRVKSCKALYLHRTRIIWEWLRIIRSVLKHTWNYGWVSGKCSSHTKNAYFLKNCSSTLKIPCF